MGAIPPEKDPINELWVWLIQQPNGVEMIASPELAHRYYPLVSTSKELAQLRMLGLAKTVERESGHPTKLVRFMRAEVVDDKD